MSENTHGGHRERLRARFTKNSLSSFEPHEALELLLSYCIPQHDVNPLAHRLIEHFGSFSQVLDAAPEELQRISGIGAYSATFLNLVAQAAGYYQRDKFRERPRLANASEMGRYCQSLFINDKGEKMYLISLNIQGQLIGHSLISTGSLDELVIYTRDVVNAALRANAYAVVITHNHPGGSLNPSRYDIDTTYELRAAMDAINVTLLDHIIVGGSRYLSMASQGYFDSPDSNTEAMDSYLSETGPEFAMQDDSRITPFPMSAGHAAESSGAHGRRKR